MRANTHIPLKERKNITFQNFLGADLSSSPLAVSPHRATRMRNLISEYGINHKRHGWRELVRIEDKNGKPQRINGIFEYNFSDVTHVIVHAGCNFYRLLNTDKQFWSYEDITLSSTYEEAKCKKELITDTRSEAFFSAGRMYIVGCGDYLVYGTWNNGESYELRRVYNNKDTYIPTTTVSIDADGVIDDRRATLDAVNLLTNKRKNQLLSPKGVALGPEGECTWTLDCEREDNSDVDIVIETVGPCLEIIENIDGFLIDTDEVGMSSPVTYYVKNEGIELYVYKRNTKDLPEKKYHCGHILGNKITLHWGCPAQIEGRDNIFVTFVETKEIEQKRYYFTVLGDSENQANTKTVCNLYRSVYNCDIKIETENYHDNLIAQKICYHVINGIVYETRDLMLDCPEGTVNLRTGEIIINKGFEPFFDSSTETYRPNIVVTLTQKPEETEKRILNSAFGVVFGVEGNTDTLFLSGNKDYPNVCFHSVADDFTYFPDINTISTGSADVANMGFGRLSDNTLAVYREPSRYEASLYYIRGSFVSVTDSQDGSTHFEERYQRSAGSIGEGCVSRHCVADFYDDNIILSKNGVFGIVLTDNVTTSERFARLRSDGINKALLAHKDLSEAVGIVYKARLYISVDGVCYVADSRYKYTRPGAQEGTFDYEWWVFDNTPVRVWQELSDKLAFGTEDGMICVFDDEYTDRTFISCEDGEITKNIDHTKLTFENGLDIKAGDGIVINTPGWYDELLSEAEVVNGRVKVDSDEIYYMHDRDKVFCDNVGESGLSINTPYYISDIDYTERDFALVDDSGQKVTALAGGFRLLLEASGQEFEICNIDIDISKSTFSLRRDSSGRVLCVCGYNNTTPENIKATVIKKKNIVAEWYSPVMDLGTNEATKTLLKVTVGCEPYMRGSLSFGYETSQVSRVVGRGYEARDIEGHTKFKDGGGFSLEDLSFENFSFDTGFANSCTKAVYVRNFNYITFRYISDGAGDCAVNNFSITYKINKSNKGVK